MVGFPRSGVLARVLHLGRRVWFCKQNRRLAFVAVPLRGFAK
jgi:hypothetical protein